MFLSDFKQHLDVMSTSVDRCVGVERRRDAPAAASESITYGVVPRLLHLAAEQSCASYRPAAQPVKHRPTAGQHKQRVVSKMLKVSKLAAMIGRGKTNMRRRQTDSSLPSVGSVDSRSTQPSPNL